MTPFRIGLTMGIAAVILALTVLTGRFLRAAVRSAPEPVSQSVSAPADRDSIIVDGPDTLRLRIPDSLTETPVQSTPSLADKSNEAWQRRQALEKADSILAHLSRIEMILNRWESNKATPSQKQRAKEMSKGATP